MTWKYTTSRETTATPADWWAVVSDVAGWPRWNAGIERLELADGFEEGALGTITPVGQTPLSFRVVACEPLAGYTSETKIADTVTLVNSQRIEPLDGGFVVWAESELTGTAAEYFGQSFGPQLAERLPATLDSLCEQAENAASPSDA